MDAPFLLREEVSVTIPLRTVIEVLREFEALGNVDATLKEADARAINVVIPKETLNFVKTALFATGSKKLSEAAKGFIRSGTCGKSGKPYYEPEPSDRAS